MSASAQPATMVLGSLGTGSVGPVRYTYANAAPTVHSQVTYSSPVTYAAPQGATYGSVQVEQGGPMPTVTYAPAPPQGASGYTYAAAPQGYSVTAEGATAPSISYSAAPQVVSYSTGPQAFAYSTSPQEVTYSAQGPSYTTYSGAPTTAPSLPPAYSGAPAPTITYGAAAPTTYTLPGASTSHPGLVQAPSMVAYPGYSAAQPYFPMSVEQAWNNHVDATLKKDLDKIMLDYDETSVVRTVNTESGETVSYRGLAQIRHMYSAVFAELQDFASFRPLVKEVEDDGVTKQVFWVWECPAAGYKSSGGTYIFGPDNKVKRQNVVITKVAGHHIDPLHAAASAASSAATGAALSAAGAATAVAGAVTSKKSSKKATKKKVKGWC